MTFGAVYQPSYIEGLTVSLDYFDIEIDQAISAFGGGAANVLRNCYSSAETGAVGSPFRNVITRHADGTIDNISVLSQNVVAVGLKGIDFQDAYAY